MLILHVAMSEGDPGLAWVWAETGATDQQQRQGKSRRKWGVGAREHPCACGDILHSVLPEELLSVGVWQRRTAWLPTDSEGPLPSHERIAPQSGRRAQRLAPWAVSALAINPGALHTLFVGCRGKESADWQFGEDAAFWRRVHELAGRLVVRQQFLPAVLYADGSWFATWCPIYGGEDRKQIDWLAEAMPLAARALNWDPRRPPAVSPGWAVTSAIIRIVDSIAKAGANRHATRAGRPPAGDSWKKAPLHHRWVESLLSPGTELRGRVRELTEFELQIEAWREPLLRTSKFGLGDEVPALSLPSGGEGFWEGRKLPEDSPRPAEMPRTPAAILERLGDLPDWQGEQKLRDWLKPVYDAASRYALEHVFGRKAEPRLRPVERQR